MIKCFHCSVDYEDVNDKNTVLNQKIRKHMFQDNDVIVKWVEPRALF